MIRTWTRSTLAIAGVAALLLSGACASSSDDVATVDEGEVRPFEESGYDPTKTAPEMADVNNDGITDTSTSTPRDEGLVGTTTIVAKGPASSTTVTTETTATGTSSMASGSSTTTGTTSSLSTTGSGTTTTVTETTTTVPMTSAAQVDDDDDDQAVAARERLRKD